MTAKIEETIVYSDFGYLEDLFPELRKLDFVFGCRCDVLNSRLLFGARQHLEVSPDFRRRQVSYRLIRRLSDRPQDGLIVTEQLADGFAIEEVGVVFEIHAQFARSLDHRKLKLKGRTDAECWHRCNCQPRQRSSLQKRSLIHKVELEKD